MRIRWFPGLILHRYPKDSARSHYHLAVPALKLDVRVRGPNSRFLVVNCEADEIPVVRWPVPVPLYDDSVLPGRGGGETENITFTWAQRHMRE